MGTKTPDIDKFDYGLQIVSGWFVRQFENEYNPLHIHTGCRMSCVGYLKLPEGIEESGKKTIKTTTLQMDTYSLHMGHLQDIQQLILLLSLKLVIFMYFHHTCSIAFIHSIRR